MDGWRETVKNQLWELFIKVDFSGNKVIQNIVGVNMCDGLWEHHPGPNDPLIRISAVPAPLTPDTC